MSGYMTIYYFERAWNKAEYLDKVIFLEKLGISIPSSSLAVDKKFSNLSKTLQAEIKFAVEQNIKKKENKQKQVLSTTETGKF